jgi:hypothetical protein
MRPTTGHFDHYYAFQFCDGSWRLAPHTQHQSSGQEDLWRRFKSIDDGAYATRDEAQAALDWACEQAAI